MRNSSIFLILLSIAIISCSSSKNYYVESDYSQEKLNTSVLVVPLQSSWFEGNLTHTFGSLSGTAQTTFYNSFGSILSGKVNSDVKMIDSEQFYNADYFQPSKLKVGKDSLNVLLPTNTSNFNASEFNPEVVLLLDKFYFRKQTTSTPSSTYSGHEGSTKSYKLYFETNYVFWHTQKQKAIAWGNTNSSVDLSSPNSSDSVPYYEAITKAIEKLSKQGPII